MSRGGGGQNKVTQDRFGNLVVITVAGRDGRRYCWCSVCGTINNMSLEDLRTCKPCKTCSPTVRRKANG